MDVKNFLTAYLPFKPHKENVPEYYFALNITPKKLQASIWKIEGDNLNIINPQTVDYQETELISATDKLLDSCLGESFLTPEKILFGVPDAWLLDDDLKDEYSKLLKNLVKELDIKPMAYVSTSHALSHYLESKEGAPATAILTGIDDKEVAVTVLRAGRVDGTKIITRSDNLGEDIEKALLSFTEVEVLPSRMLIFSEQGSDLTKQKAILLAFPWMDKLSFLHFPKIDILEKDLLMKAVALAGATEINPQIKLQSVQPKEGLIEVKPENNFGFVTGDITQTQEKTEIKNEPKLFSLKVPFLPNKYKFLSLPISALVILILAYLFFAKAQVSIFVEPRMLERDTQVTADPKVKAVDEVSKIIPGEVMEVSVSGSDKAQASGKKQIGDSAKGTVKIINNSSDAQILSQGTVVSSNGLKFTLDTSITIASTSAIADTKSTKTVSVTAAAAGADGNLSSGAQFSSANPKVAIVAEGNFSGGTSREVTVVSDSDQKKLLASLAASLRKQAAEKLQGKLVGQKILEEGLAEEITSKSYSKNINDQANEFSLNLTIKYKGTVYKEEDLKLIVSKLLESAIPEDFELNLAQTETLADVSKLEKDGRLIFLAKFRAKLMPKLDQEKIKEQIKGQTPQAAAGILKTYDNVLSSDISIVPALPNQVSRLPFLTSNIKLEVKLK